VPGASDICKGAISYHFDMRCPPFKKNIVMTKQEIETGLSAGQDLFYANAGTMRCLRVAQVNYANTNDLFSSIRFEGERRFQKVPSYYLCFMKTK